ncbi:MAG: DUF3267 domain-containing protein [Defluviitaleaceae bacterium]|nr:DUF3267 domain-containing protein [Defluviitaleaceae bacterium]MCL2274712.1 DUF3267 domain-containing protein [Defluviitaleaceae bacterium]
MNPENKRGVHTLPPGYTEFWHVNFGKNAKSIILFSLAATALAAPFLLLGWFIQPASFGLGLYVSRAVLSGALFLCVMVCFVSHELVHGLFMKIFSDAKIRFGFVGYAAYAASEGYFNKKQYIIITLAPVVLHSFVFVGLLLFLPRTWFWDIYILQVVNIGGAAGDFYMSVLMRKMPKDILVKDDGTRMTIYARQAAHG